MVHALEEIRRVLIQDGILLDLHPVAERWPIEIVRGNDTLVTGRITDLPSALDDDRAADVAIEEAIRRGWFIRKKKVFFEYNEYWDNPDELIEHVTEQWSSFSQLGDDVQKATRNAWKTASDNWRLRIKFKMLLNHMQKLL